MITFRSIVQPWQHSLKSYALFRQYEQTGRELDQPHEMTLFFVYMHSCTLTSPKRLNNGSAPVVLDSQTHFRMQFNEQLDNILETMCRHLQRPRMQLYKIIEETIISAASNKLSQHDLKAHTETSCQHFGDDLNRKKLRPNFLLLADLIKPRQTIILKDM